MKRKTLITMVGTMALLMAVSGCGQKSKAEQAAEYYQEEFGMTKEEAEQLANEFDDAGLYDLEETGNQKSESQKSDQQENTFKLFDVMPEIENSKIGDGIVQVNDVLLHDDGTMTLGEAIDKLKNSEDGDKLIYVCWTKDQEFQLDGLIDARSIDCVKVYYGDDYSDFYSELCSIYVYNASDEIAEEKDACIVSVEGSVYNWPEAPYSLNVFYAGNLNYGLYDDDLKESEYYGKNATMPRLTYDTVEAFLDNQNAADVTYDESSHKYIATILREMPCGQYIEEALSIQYDMQTKECTIHKISGSRIHDADSTWKYIKLSQKVSNDDMKVIVNAAKEKLLEKCDDGVSIKAVGTISDSGSLNSWNIVFFEVTNADGQIEYRACEAGTIKKFYDGSFDMEFEVLDSTGANLEEYVPEVIYLGKAEDLVPISE